MPENAFHDIGVIDVLREPFPEHWDTAVLTAGAGPSRDAYRSMLREFDVAIMLPGAHSDASGTALQAVPLSVYCFKYFCKNLQNIKKLKHLTTPINNVFYGLK